MPLNLVPPERLTWHPSLPSPFESGASIFRMVLALNHLPMEKLCLLIHKRNGQHINFTRTEVLTSDWIDFNRFGTLLGVQPERIKRGFLDQLGFIGSTRSREGAPQTKYCPKCRTLGYHCVFFDLAIVTECPWHRCPLLNVNRPCILCSPFVKDFYLGQAFSDCPYCGGGGLKSITEQCFNRFDEVQTATILGYCAEFLMWRQAVKKSVGDHENLIADIDSRSTSADIFSRSFTSWKLSHALTSTKADIYWKFKEPLINVRHIKCIDKSVADAEIKTRIRDEYGVQYRSIKRHIFKRYVRSHLSCVNKLQTLTRDESMLVDGDVVCTVALAYVIWCMSIEGIGNIEAFRKKRVSNYELRLMAPDADCSPVFRLRWSYLSFFSLARHFEQLCGREKLSVDFDIYHPCEGYLCSCRQQSKSGDAAKFQRVFDVLYPCFDNLALSIARCREKLHANGVSSWCVDLESSWYWAREDLHHGTMFRVQTAASIHSKSHYLHMMV